MTVPLPVLCLWLYLPRLKTAFSRDGSFSIAAHLNEALALGDWKFYTTLSKNIDAVTSEMV
jgi:zinc protease